MKTVLRGIARTSHSRAVVHNVASFVCLLSSVQNIFCMMRVPGQTGKGPRPMQSGPRGKSDLVVQRAGWTSDHCHCHCLFVSSLSNVCVAVGCLGRDRIFDGCVGILACIGQRVRQ